MTKVEIRQAINKLNPNMPIKQAWSKDLLMEVLRQEQELLRSAAIDRLLPTLNADTEMEATSLAEASSLLNRISDLLSDFRVLASRVFEIQVQAQRYSELKRIMKQGDTLLDDGHEIKEKDLDFELHRLLCLVGFLQVPKFER